MSTEHYSQDEPLEVYPIVVGLTRPATVGGVPITYAAMSAMMVGLAYIFFERLEILPIYGIFHGLGWVLQSWDARFIDVCFMKMRKCWFVRNSTFWGGNSYQP